MKYDVYKGKDAKGRQCKIIVLEFQYKQSIEEITNYVEDAIANMNEDLYYLYLRDYALKENQVVIRVDDYTPTRLIYTLVDLIWIKTQ